MANKRILLALLIAPLAGYVLASGALAPNNNENAPEGYGVCYGCYGWQREALDWGLIGGMAAGGYLSS
ncbi:MAG: hypothetical protein U9Q76_07390, partial [candidate division WOR-3 bacterium]|nr:hypothetical protein [candidate division WOR-3 bacterium]